MAVHLSVTGDVFQQFDINLTPAQQVVFSAGAEQLTDGGEKFVDFRQQTLGQQFGGTGGVGVKRAPRHARCFRQFRH